MIMTLSQSHTQEKYAKKKHCRKCYKTLPLLRITTPSHSHTQETNKQTKQNSVVNVQRHAHRVTHTQTSKPSRTYSEKKKCKGLALQLELFLYKTLVKNNQKYVNIIEYYDLKRIK